MRGVIRSERVIISSTEHNALMAYTMFECLLAWPFLHPFIYFLLNVLLSTQSLLLKHPNRVVLVHAGNNE